MPLPATITRALSATHRRLLTCYPREFRAHFGGELQRVFEERLSAAARRTPWRLMWFLTVALLDVPISGWAERFRRMPARVPRQRRRVMSWDSLMTDVRIACRMLRHAPALTLLSVTALGLGIGVTTAMFSVVDGVLLKPLPYTAPERLIRIRGGQSYPDLQDWIKETTRFEGFGGFRSQSFDHPTSGGTDRLPGVLVTGGLFDAMGIRAPVGRLIGEADDRPGGEHVLVLSHGFWKRQFAGRPDVIGKVLRFVDDGYRIIGVLPADFAFPLTPADVVAATRAESTEFGFRGVHSLVGLGRLATGVTLPEAQAEMDALAARLAERAPQSNRDQRFVLQPVNEWLAGRFRSPILWLFGAVIVVWLIACANVANLQLGRAIGRRPEMAMRRALGATRPQLVRQLLVEHVAVAAAAGLAGAVVAWWCIRLLAGFGLDSVPRLDQVAIDGRALTFATLSAVVTAVVFGIVPALAASGGESGAAMGHGQRVYRQGRRLVAALLVAEVAVTLVLTIGGGLLLGSYARLMRVDPGFDPDRLLTFNLTLRPLPRTARAGSPEMATARIARQLSERTQYFDHVIRTLAGLPGVTSVAASTDLPIAEGTQYHNMIIEEQPRPEGAEPEVYYRGVSAGFFQAFGVRLIRGREFSSDDTAATAPVAIVNETFARRHFAGADPLGRRVRFTGGAEPWITIVGVAADVKAIGLDADEVPALYAPFAQDRAVWRRSMDLAIRTTGDPARLTTSVRRAVASVDPSIPVMRLQTMSQLIARSALDRRLVLSLLGLFALIALTLVAIGLYSAVAYAVRMRTPEFGLRMALGASPGDVVHLALRQAWWCTAAGTLLGVAGAAASVQVLTSLLFQVAATDGLTYGLASVFVGTMTTLAALVPASRAARIDPIIVLRRL